MQESTPASAEDTIRLEIELSQREEEVRQLNDQLREFTSALSQKNVEVEQLMKTCSELEQSLQQNIEELSTSISTKDDEINSQITAKDVQLAASVATLAEKEVHIEELRRKLTDTESRLVKLRTNFAIPSQENSFNKLILTFQIRRDESTRAGISKVRFYYVN